MHAGGLGLAVEVIQGSDLVAVIQLDGRCGLAVLLGLVVAGHKAVAQGLGHGGKRAILGQQQGDLTEWLIGQLLELVQLLGQVLRGRVLRVLLAPGVNGGLLLFRRAVALGGARQCQPAVQVGIAAVLQLAEWQAVEQGPDGLMVAVGGCAAEQGGDKDSLACCWQSLAAGRQGVGAGQLAAHLLLDW